MPESAPGILQRHQSTTVVLARALDGTLIIASLWIANLAFQHKWNERLTLAAVIGSVIYKLIISIGLRLGLAPTDLKLATGVMQQHAFRVTIELHRGRGCASVLTCDFSVDYVRINADYRS